MKGWKRLVVGGGARRDIGLLLLRVYVGLSMCLLHGFSKVFNFPRFLEGVAEHGFPAPIFSAGFAASSEFLGGLLLALGLLSRGAALSLFVTMAFAAFWVHGGDPIAKKELALFYGVTSLTLAMTGPGRHSLDEGLGWLKSKSG